MVLDFRQFAIKDVDTWEEITRGPSQAGPMTLADVQALVGQKMDSALLRKMIRNRGVLVKPSGETLARLKQAGASDEVVAAVSTYALGENKAIDLLLTVDFDQVRPGLEPQYLYVGLVSNQAQEDLLASPLSGLYSDPDHARDLTDTSDPLLPRSLRRVRLRGLVRGVHHGPSEFRLLVSPHPDILDLSDGAKLSSADAQTLDRLPFDYPEVSRVSACQLDVVMSVDPLISKGAVVKSRRLRCFWE